MKTHVKILAELDKETYKKLYRLNNGRKGWEMRYWLVAHRNNKKRYWNSWRLGQARYDWDPPAYVVFVQDDNEKILSWALLFSHNYGTPNPRIQIYTKKSHRRTGLGKIVLEKITSVSKEIYGTTPTYYPHDNSSVQFFRNSIQSNILAKDKAVCYGGWEV